MNCSPSSVTISCGPAYWEATCTVASDVLFTTTWMTSGTRVWASSPSMTAAIDCSSLYAGMTQPIVERCVDEPSNTESKSSGNEWSNAGGAGTTTAARCERSARSVRADAVPGGAIVVMAFSRLQFSFGGGGRVGRAGGVGRSRSG